MNSVARDDSPSILASINQADTDIAIWKRSIGESLQQIFGPLRRNQDAFDARADVDTNAPDFSEISAALPTEAMRHAFEIDAHSLLALFSTFEGAGRVRVRLQLTDRQNCPKFHIDAVRARLITTYTGSGTEWLPASAVADVQSPHADHAHISPASDEKVPVRQVSMGDVVAFSGKDAINRDRAHTALHRSPVPDEGCSRLVFRLTAGHRR